MDPVFTIMLAVVAAVYALPILAATLFIVFFVRNNSRVLARRSKILRLEREILECHDAHRELQGEYESLLLVLRTTERERDMWQAYALGGRPQFLAVIRSLVGEA